MNTVLFRAYPILEWWLSYSAFDIATGIPQSNDATVGLWQKHTQSHSVLYRVYRGAVSNTIQGAPE